MHIVPYQKTHYLAGMQHSLTHPAIAQKKAPCGTRLCTTCADAWVDKLTSRETDRAKQFQQLCKLPKHLDSRHVARRSKPYIWNELNVTTVRQQKYAVLPQHEVKMCQCTKQSANNKNSITTQTSLEDDMKPDPPILISLYCLADETERCHHECNVDDDTYCEHNPPCSTLQNEFGDEGWKHEH